MANVTLSKEKILSLFFVLNVEIPATKQKISTKCAFVFNYNIDILESVVKAIAESTKPNKESEQGYNAYATELMESIKPFCVMENDKPKLSERGLPLIENKHKEVVGPIVEKINEKYKDMLAKKNAEDNEIDSMLKETIDVDLVQVSFNSLPEFLSINQIRMLRPIIKEDDESIKKLLSE
jgi:hypothetical protein